MAHHPAGSPHKGRLARTAYLLCVVSAGLTGWLYIKPRTRGLSSNLLGYGLKIAGAALSPLIAVTGLVGAMLARRTGQPFVSLIGGLGAVLGAQFVRRVSTPESDVVHLAKSDQRPTGDEKALPRRWHWGQVAIDAKAVVIRDLAYATVPGTKRALLCDLWQPALDLRRSGVGVIFLHGGAWQAFDKDVATRPFFRHLTAQGHVVMDVAYRLARETDMRGMLADAKRAVAWLRAQGPALGVNPERIVLAGGSAGGHLALLAAYTANHPDYDPDELQQINTAVRGVFAYYPVTDLRTLTDHWSEQSMHPLATAIGRSLGYFAREGYLPWSRLAQRLFGGPLETLGDALLAYSPIAHVSPACPPTLIVQGLHDHVIPVEDALKLHRALVVAGADAAIVRLPMVEHAFDLFALQISPPAQAALYDVDRFLARLST
jgi:acetyl esterase/lipase